MRRFNLIIAALALFAASPALAQSGCGGQFGAGKFCGNPNPTTGLPGPVSLTPAVLAPIAGGTVIGNPGTSVAAPQATTAPVLGIPGTSTGQVGIAGSTSGTAILRAQAAAGSAVSLLPTAAGTLVGTAASPLAINATTGQISITGQAGGVLAGAGPAFTQTPTLGVAGSAIGTLGFAGNTSGTVTLTPQATAGTATLTLPNTSGTFAVGASSPLVLSATTGGLTCPTCVTSSGGGAITGVAPINVSAAGAVSITGSALTKTDDTNVTLTLGGAPTTALISATSLTLGWTGQLGPTRGGTGTGTYALGDTLYGSGVNTLAKLSGNITAAKQYLSQTGTGTVSAAPAWATIAGADITGAAMTSGNDTNVTLTLGGTPATSLLRAASITAGWTGQLSLTRGGTNASLTASNGGIFYSTASAGAILAGTATANQMLQSGSSAAPAWSTATYPATTAAGTILGSSSANVVAATATPTLGVNGGTGGQITLNGATSGSAVVKVAAAAGTTNFQLPVGNGTNGQVLQTDGSGNTSWTSVAGTGTVTSVAAGTGMSFTTITTTGSVAIDKATTANIWAATSNKTLTADNVFNAAGAFTVLSGTSSVTPDFSTGFNFSFTATSATNFTLNNPTNAKTGQTGCVFLSQPASGTVVTITFGTNWVTPGGVTGINMTQSLGATNIACYVVLPSGNTMFTMDTRSISH